MGVYSIALYFRGKEGKDKVAHDLPPEGKSDSAFTLYHQTNPP